VKSGVTANFTQQGIATLSTLPQDYSQILEKCVQRSGAFYGAIDLLVQDGHPYVLEINSVPGIEQLEKVSGRNVIKEFVHGFMS
jgi:glutathione synthase/RimK-type ligase-like ATP-grasp enzyme